MGYTDTMKLVNVDCDPKYLGEIVDVVITDIKTWSMEGVIKKWLKVVSRSYLIP